MWYLFALITIVFFYFFLIMPRYTHHRQWKVFKDFDYAHRGLHDATLPENTLAAFKAAIDHGYGFELDVQKTKDEQLVVLHDFNLKRACNIDKNVEELTYAELRTLKVFESDHGIPLLLEVLQLVNGQVPLIIEIKQRTSDCRICELAALALDHYQGPFCVESFNPHAVLWFKKQRNSWIRGQLVNHFNFGENVSTLTSFALRNLFTNWLTRPDFIAHDVDLIERFNFRVYRDLLKGSTVLWTIKDRDTFDRLKDRHDLMIFENFTV